MQRPSVFTIDPQHHLASGLVFAGLGAHAGSNHYHDSSNYGNNGTAANIEASDWSMALSRRIVILGGTDECIQLPGGGVGAFAGCDNFTITQWIWCEDASVESRTFARGTGTGNDPSIQIFSGGVRGIVGGDGGGGQVVGSSYSISDKTWFCVSLAFDQSTFNLNVDGVERYSDTAVTTTDTDATFIQIGARGGDPASASFHVGRIGDTLIHNRVLSPDEIRQLADPSNVMLSGLIEPYWQPLSYAEAAASNAMPMAIHQYKMAGGL